MLTLELRKLEEAGVVRRTAHAGYPLRVEYALTPAGTRLMPLIDALGAWWKDRADPEPPAKPPIAAVAARRAHTRAIKPTAPR
jgi:DNA-binding HxlR family transcriptional regulator